MTTTVVLGAQWGDEGKGKVTDFLLHQLIMSLDFKAEIMPDTL